VGVRVGRFDSFRDMRLVGVRVGGNLWALEWAYLLGSVVGVRVGVFVGIKVGVGPAEKNFRCAQVKQTCVAFVGVKLGVATFSIDMY